MAPTNIVAHELEGYGVRTFSAKEMGFNILGLMHPLLFSITQVEPIWADLNGGMDRLPDLADITTRIRTQLNKKADLRRAIARDNSADFKVINGIEAERLLQTVDVLPRANFTFDFPALESSSSLSQLSHLRGLIDLEKVVVITGYGEVGPWGSSRTRWEMEVRGEFTIEGGIEMAWMMGFIKHFDGRLKDGSLYVGWVDSKTNEPIDDKDIKGRYEKDILTHGGVRIVGEYYVVIAPHLLNIPKNLSYSVATILTRRSSTKRLSLSTTSNPSRCPTVKQRSTRCNMATSATFGLVKAATGLRSSRKALSYSSLRHSSSLVLSLARFQLDGLPDDMASPTTLSPRPTAQHFGLWSPLLRLSTRRASPIHMSCTSTCILRTSVLALVVEWEASVVWPRCSRIVGTKSMSKMISSRKRK